MIRGHQADPQTGRQRRGYRPAVQMLKGAVAGIGRSIWWDPLRGHLRHLSTTGEVRRRIRAAYLDYARYYLKAREGTLPAEPDSAL
jgi:hypothetical protein